jgi:hypothetical protein
MFFANIPHVRCVSNELSSGLVDGRVCVDVCVSFASMTQANDSPYRLPPFAHYQPILDRMPFGAMPVVAPQVSADQAAAAATEAEVFAEQQALANQVTLSAVTSHPRGIPPSVLPTVQSIRPQLLFARRRRARTDGR